MPRPVVEEGVSTYDEIVRITRHCRIPHLGKLRSFLDMTLVKKHGRYIDIEYEMALKQAEDRLSAKSPHLPPFSSNGDPSRDSV